MPYVSVIIPCYNLQDFIVDCIISVEEQTYKNFEIIVIDDGSKDESAKRIKEYIAKSGVSNIRLFCKKNGGASSARNEGIRRAEGKYVSFIDGDDFVDADYLMNRVEAIRNNNADMCVGGLRVYENGKFGSETILKRLFLEGKAVESHIDELNFMFIDPFGKLYKKEILIKNSVRFDERIKTLEDLAFSLDYFYFINKLQIIDDCTYNYRIRPDSLIHRVSLPTEQKYVWDHFVQYFHRINQEYILQINPVFCSYAWNLGLLNRIQSNIIENKSIVDLVDSTEASKEIKNVKLANKKDKIFLCCLKNRQYLIIKCLVKMKYFILKKCMPLYRAIKKILTS